MFAVADPQISGSLGLLMFLSLNDFVLFTIVGFLAQLVDGALGKGYGIISSAVLLASGVPPAHTSASVHASKLFTTATSGASHALHGNVDRRILIILSIAGTVGGVLGAMVTINTPAQSIRPYVFGYLGIMGMVIIWRAIKPPSERRASSKFIAPLGTVGGFLDAIGGGGWGPVVTSNLLGAGLPPRYVVGTVNASEFLVTCAVVASFAISLFFGVWEESDGIAKNLAPVVGLVVGGIPSALFAGWLLKVAPRQPLMMVVGLLICGLSIWEVGKVVF